MISTNSVQLIVRAGCMHLFAAGNVLHVLYNDHRVGGIPSGDFEYGNTSLEFFQEAHHQREHDARTGAIFFGILQDHSERAPFHIRGTYILGDCSFTASVPSRLFCPRLRCI